MRQDQTLEPALRPSGVSTAMVIRYRSSGDAEQPQIANASNAANQLRFISSGPSRFASHSGYYREKDISIHFPISVLNDPALKCAVRFEALTLWKRSPLNLRPLNCGSQGNCSSIPAVTLSSVISIVMRLM